MSKTHLSTPTAGAGSLRTTIVVGAGAGVLASLAMAMYAMIASWLKDTGVLTPLYHIASLVTSKESMMASMQAASDGSAFHLALGPALIGAMIHMMTGAMYGTVFAVLARRFFTGPLALVVAGAVYGGLVFAVSAWVGLPLAAAVLSSGDQIANMAQLAGWGTFFCEHVVFGLSLGALVAARPTLLR